MKNLINAMLMVILIASFGVACNSGDADKSSDQTEQSEQVDENGPEYTSKYVCPMKCKGSGSDKPGNCPVCEMPYVLNENYKGDSSEGDSSMGEAEHDHDHDHDHEH